MDVQEPGRAGGAPGFTLPELLCAIVLVGLLSGAAILDIGSLPHTASTNACVVSARAAAIASAVYFVNTHGTYPTRWANLTTSSPPLYVLQNGVTVNRRKPKELDGDGWKLTMRGGGATETTFRCR
jgi:prepilin-type N-terminal cleavage/methylation domain-containing protein